MKTNKEDNKVHEVLMNMLKIIKFLLIIIISIVIIIFLWHQISNLLYKNKVKVPGDLIKIYDKEYIHTKELGKGKYTFVLLPGMGTSSPYYDYYKLADSLSKDNHVLVLEPLGYGFSSITSKKRNLKNYENEINKVLNNYKVKDNIIFIAHSYSGPITLYYANKYQDKVKGLICLDCTSAYQIATHVKEGKFKEEVPKQEPILSWLANLGIVRLVYTFMDKEIYNELLIDVPKKYHDNYKYLLYNKSLNKTILNEINNFPYIELKMLNKKYNDNLYVRTFLSSETIEEMKEYKEYGDFKYDWEEMHNHMISNPNIQKIINLKGNHYIHHNNVEKIVKEINKMLEEMSI